jgi:hypothetical protein
MWLGVAMTSDDSAPPVTGAAVHQRLDIEGRFDHVVMLDPEGNEFCIV